MGGQFVHPLQTVVGLEGGPLTFLDWSVFFVGLRGHKGLKLALGVHPEVSEGRV